MKRTIGKETREERACRLFREQMYRNLFRPIKTLPDPRKKEIEESDQKDLKDSKQDL